MMKQEIAEFNKQNGNAQYNNKDMLKYVVQKLDKMDEKNDRLIGELHKKLNSRFEKCSANFMDRATFWKVIIVLVIGLIASGVFAVVT